MLVLEGKSAASHEPVVLADTLPGNIAMETVDRNRPAKEFPRIDRSVFSPETQAPRIVAGRDLEFGAAEFLDLEPMVIALADQPG